MRSTRPSAHTSAPTVSTSGNSTQSPASHVAAMASKPRLISARDGYFFAALSASWSLASLS